VSIGHRVEGRPLTHISFAEKIIKAVNGEKGVTEPSFVYLPGVPGGDAIAKATGCDFFSVPIELGVSWSKLLARRSTDAKQPSGAEKAVDVVSSANDAEKKLLEACYSGLKDNITKGIEFVQNPPQKWVCPRYLHFTIGWMLIWVRGR
jgi:malate dehydrogenase